MRARSPSECLPLVLLLAAALSSCAFFIPLKAIPGSIGNALESDGTVKVTQGDIIAFTPGESRDTGFIFYPGARVAPEAYALTARTVAKAGFPAYLVRMPFNFAIFDTDAALRVMAAHPETKRWVLSGHSLGGAMACAFAGKHPGLTSGLVLLAAYPGGGTDLSGLPVPVLSVSGSLDGLATTAKTDAARKLLPGSAEFIVLEGGNHAQFGSYGKQEGDKEATMGADDQLKATTDAIVKFLEAEDTGQAAE